MRNSLFLETGMVMLFFILWYTSLQAQEGRLLQLDQRLGNIIEADEQKAYNLFPDIGQFYSARLYQITKNQYKLIIRTGQLSDTTKTESIKYLDGREHAFFREYMKHFLEIRSGMYSFYSGKGSNIVPLDLKTDSMLTVNLSDGSRLNGSIKSQSPLKIYFQTFAGLKIELPRKMIQSVELLHGTEHAGQFRRFDPNYSRLLFAPTGRTLKKGDGYFSDYYVFFPGIAYGFTDYFTLMAGVSIFPGLGFNEQMYYFAPRMGFNLSEKADLSGGFLYTSFGGEFEAGIAFAVGTYGQRDRSFTLGLGLGYTRGADDNNDGFRFAHHPIIMFGGNYRLSNSLALVSENWLITGSNFDLKEQPFSLVLRFFGERLSVDAGFIFVGEALKEGFPVPWLSFVYNFGR